jgi:hypothetical protein
MRVPTVVEVILASAAVGVLVLFTKRPELPPVPQLASSITGAPLQPRSLQNPHPRRQMQPSPARFR